MTGPRKNLGLELATVALILAFSLARSLRTRVCVDPLEAGEPEARTCLTEPLPWAKSLAPPTLPTFERLHTPLDIPVNFPERAREPRGGDGAVPGADLGIPVCPFAARDRREPLRC